MCAPRWVWAATAAECVGPLKGSSGGVGFQLEICLAPFAWETPAWQRVHKLPAASQPVPAPPPVQEGAVLCFDEVMTGFRIAKGCAQEHFGVTPDLTTMGKVIGGGLPVGAYGGKKEIMQMVAPAGPMYQVGTGEQQGCCWPAGRGPAYMQLVGPRSPVLVPAWVLHPP